MEVTRSNSVHGELCHLLQRDSPCLNHTLCHVCTVQMPNALSKVPPENHVLEPKVLPNLQEVLGTQYRLNNLEDCIVDTIAVRSVFPLGSNESFLGASKGEQVNDK